MARLHEFVWSREILGSDARDRNRHAVQRSAAPDDRGVTAEAALPIGITQDDDRTSSEFIAFAGKKDAAIGRLCADRLKEIAGDIVDKHALTSVIGCEAASLPYEKWSSKVPWLQPRASAGSLVRLR